MQREATRQDPVQRGRTCLSRSLQLVMWLMSIVVCYGLNIKQLAGCPLLYSLTGAKRTQREVFVAC